MAQTLINIRMDEELKRSFDKVCSELGMNMTTAITIFAKKMVRENRVPFEVSIDPFYSEKNLQSLEESKKQLESGNTVVKTLDELRAMEDE
ncbi:MAG: type II toxin-antitoxin system RelB/DinJ family antitoxin [Eubacteriales bacterium]